MDMYAGIGRGAAERTSEILMRFARETDAGNVSVGTLLDALKDRGFGILIILFALPTAFLPLAWIFGTPVLIFSVQLVLGLPEPWLPEPMRRVKISAETFVRLMTHSIRNLTRVEEWLKPRWVWLTGPIMERILGVYLVFLTIILLVPVVPFGNALPAFGLAIIAAGLMERDGLAIIFGAFVGMLGSIYVILMLGGVWAVVKAATGF